VPLSLTTVEQWFDVQLDPVRAEIAVTVKILKEADLAPGSSGRVLWDAHVRQLQALAATLPPATLADLGLTAVPGQEKPAGGGEERTHNYSCFPPGSPPSWPSAPRRNLPDSATGRSRSL